MTREEVDRVLLALKRVCGFYNHRGAVPPCQVCKAHDWIVGFTTWFPMGSVPRDRSRVLAIYPDGEVDIVYFCQNSERRDPAGTNQRGVFFSETLHRIFPEPIGWRPLPTGRTKE